MKKVDHGWVYTNEDDNSITVEVTPLEGDKRIKKSFDGSNAGATAARDFISEVLASDDWTLLQMPIKGMGCRIQTEEEADDGERKA